MDDVKHLFDSFLTFAMDYLGIPKCPDIYLKSDKANSKLPLGKTGSYDPMHKKIIVFTDNRHIKDILRSLSHELVHHRQNLQGMFDKSGYHGPGYAQKNQHLRNMEREAYEIGNLCLRDWEDKHKKQLQESIYTIKGDNSKMSYKKWRNGEINERLMESWGYKAPKSEVINENEEISHLCAMLVTEKSSGKVGHPINHTLLEDGTVTHYDVEFDDVIVEGMPVESLDVDVQQEHMHTGRREDKDHDEEKPRVSNEAHCGRREDEQELEEDIEEGLIGMAGDVASGVGKIAAAPVKAAADIVFQEDEEDLEEGEGADLEERRTGRADPRRTRAPDTRQRPLEEKDGAKPDFPDVDGDGDRDEPITKAQKDKEDKEGGDKEEKDLSKVPPQLRKHVSGKKTNEDLIRKTIREAIVKALKERSGD